MKLYYTPTSPFVRKVLVVAHELGLAGKIEQVLLRPTPLKADPELSRINPLNKIPALVLDDGSVLYDSSVIVEYLATLGWEGTRVLPASGPERLRARRLEALADGVLEAAILVFYERHNRPEALWFQPWLDGQSEKARQGLDALEAEAASLGDDLGAICAAVTFAWLEFRKPLGDIREGRPNLTAFYERFAARPAMLATVPVL
ncbi:MAG: glutathione S-transferase N-terminal domain-containing protein [Myxococcales bacterium]|nr:glutathione S-transferase N-terminal domain-containing protein [Myxococcales bacterium]